MDQTGGTAPRCPTRLCNVLQGQSHKSNYLSTRNTHREPSLLVPILAVCTERKWIIIPNVDPPLQSAKDGGCQVGEIMSEWTSIADHIGGDGSSAADCKEGLDFEGGCFACDDIIVGWSGDNNNDSDNNNNGGISCRILLRIQSLDWEDHGEDGLEILPAKKGVRIKVMGDSSLRSVRWIIQWWQRSRWQQHHHRLITTTTTTTIWFYSPSPFR